MASERVLFSLHGDDFARLTCPVCGSERVRVVSITASADEKVTILASCARHPRKRWWYVLEHDDRGLVMRAAAIKEFSDVWDKDETERDPELGVNDE